MKFKNIILVIVFSLFVIQPTKVESADIVSDILGTAIEQSKKNKLELQKWGLPKKDLVGLKSKEIKSLLNGNIIFGEWNDDFVKGKTESTYYDDGSYEAVLSGKLTDGGKKATLKEKGTWSAKQGKVCFKGIQFYNNEEREYAGCSKVLKSKSNPNDYFLRNQGVIYLKFVKIISIKDKIEEERIAKEKKEEKRLAEEEKIVAEEEKKIAKEEKKQQEEEEKLQKKLKLFPQRSELENAQHFLNNVEAFIALYQDEFDVVKISEFLILTKPISENIFEEKQKNDLALFKDYTSTSSKFRYYFDRINQEKFDMQLNEIENIYDELESSKKNLETKLASNDKLTKAANHIKDIEILLENPESINQLKAYNESVKTYIASLDQKQSILDTEVAEAHDNILELKEKLKEDLTSDLAPLIIQQVKLLEEALEKENSMEPSLFLKDLVLANKKAYQFIDKNWLEAERKKAEEERIAKEKEEEEERIAEEKEAEEERRREADNKFHYKSAWGNEKLYDCKSLAKEAKKVKLSNMLGGQFTVITLTNVTETINNRSELSCVGDARLSNGSESKLIMRAFHVNEETLIEVRQDQQDMLNKFLKELGQ